MHISSVLSGISLLATISLSAPVANSNSAPPFQITKTKIHEIEGGNTTLTFTVYDPDPLTNATQKCTYSWKTGSNDYPAGPYEPCGSSNFAWTMQSYTSLSSFVIGIEHVFTDPAVGEYPYDMITDFGNANITAPDIWCTAMGGQASCQQQRNSTIEAPITATIAKRR